MWELGLFAYARSYLYDFLFLQERIQIENGTLTISMLNMSDSGLYQCVAENQYDSIYSNAELRVMGKFKAEKDKQDNRDLNK